MFNDLAPTLIVLFLAACVLWLIWSALRRLFRSPKEAQAPSLAPDPKPTVERGEPTVQPVSAPAQAIPDAADVLALKAAIDNLARQVAALEKRLASGQTSLQAVQVPPAGEAAERLSEVFEAPPVVPDRRV
jgi:Na+-transporting methylmalonyl-CoA/oxaloacetate decarboxylase gamma subunit